MELVHRTLTTPDWLMIVFYFGLMLGVSFYVYRFVQEVKDYFKGGNLIPWWLSGVSFWMTSFSVAAFVFYPSLCYRYGWVGITLLWVAVPATIFSAYVFGWRWRRLRVSSPVEFVEERYSPTLRQIFVWQGVPVRIVDDSMKLFATGKFVSIVTQLPIEYSIILVGGIILICTFLGGLWAVTITDFIQFLVLGAGLLVILPLSIHYAGGLNKVINSLPEGFFRITHEEYPWSYVLPLVILYAFSWSSINWSLIQRYYCVKNENEVKKVGLTVIILYIIGPPLMFFPAFAGKLIVPELDDAGNIYPLLCAKLLPAGMLGLLISAMFSATMSTLSSDYNVCASVITQDVYRRIIRKNADNEELILVGRLSTVLVGLVALIISLYLAKGKAENLFRVMVTLFGVATGPVAVPMMLGILSKRYSAKSAITGFGLGSLVGLMLLYLQMFVPTRDFPLGIKWLADKKEFLVWSLKLKMEILMFLTTTGVTYLVMELISILWPVSFEESEKIKKFFVKMEKSVGELDDDKEIKHAKSRISPYNIVGFCGIVIAILLTIISSVYTYGFDRLIGIIVSLLSLLGGLMFLSFGYFASNRNQEPTNSL